MTTILKLGGSVITHKDQPESINQSALETAARAVSESTEDLVIIHGGGSFGHHAATKHNVSKTRGTTNAASIRAIHSAMKQLNHAVIESLAVRDVPAIPVHAFPISCRDESDNLTVTTQSIETLLHEGFIPVTHGDVASHLGKGATILSGDELVVHIASTLHADRVGLCSAVPGVLDENDTVIEQIQSYTAVKGLFDSTEAPDVTGGMAGKVQELLTLSTSSHIFGLEDLDLFLSGEEPGTRIG